MKTLKAALLVLVTLPPSLLSADPTGQSRTAPPGDLPRITPVYRRLLTQCARRTLAAHVAEGEPYSPDYIPPALAAVQCQAVVTLRQQGYAVGIGISRPQPVVQACCEAARLALAGASRERRADPSLAAKVRIEIQLLGSATPYTRSTPWTEPGALVDFIDPGLHGVRIHLDDEQYWFTAGEMIAKNLPLNEALRTLAKEASLHPQALNRGVLSRFRTLHWWEADEEGHIASLRRGMVPLAPEAVTADTLEGAINRLVRYMIYRQRPDGRFAYEYRPAADHYTDSNDEVAQSGAAWALAWYAAHSDGRASGSSADRAIRARLEQLVELPGVPGACFIAADDAHNKLGITAQACLALADHPDPARYADQRRRLAKAMLWLQRPSGKLIPAFPPSLVLATQDVPPGQALVALARCYELEPTAELLAAIDAAFSFYAAYFNETGSPTMIPWHTQAYATMAGLTKKRSYVDFVFRMNDRVCAHQLTPDDSDLPVLWGAITTRGLPPSAFTAAFVAGLADAAVLAQATGDTERFERYARACKLGARFVMQLQVKPEECYYIHSYEDAVDGIRTSPINSRLAIDSCQHALMALAKTRELLFPDPP